MRIKIGSRRSPLAMAQAAWVQERLREKFPKDKFEIRAIQTLGDRKKTWDLEKISAKGIFTRDIELALLDRTIDLAVHSLKDLPVELQDGLVLGGVPLREDPRDVLVSAGKKSLARLKKGATVGTGSSRRSLQLLMLRPDLKVTAIRGNVQTRVQRVAQGDLDAVILAGAGLKRLGLEDKISEVFEPEQMLPAVGQGALAIEMRQGDKDVMRIVDGIRDADSDCAARAERAFLGALGGGCRVPIGGMARCAQGKLTLWGGVFSADGHRNFRGMRNGEAGNAETIGKALAEDLMRQGAKEILSHG